MSDPSPAFRAAFAAGAAWDADTTCRVGRDEAVQQAWDAHGAPGPRPSAEFPAVHPARDLPAAVELLRADAPNRHPYGALLYGMAADVLEGQVTRVAQPEFPFDPPVAPPSQVNCYHCVRKLVIVGREVSDGRLEVVGMPRFRWAHADDLTVDCVRTFHNAVRPYSGWMTQLDEQLISQETNRRYDEREDALDAAEAACPTCATRPADLDTEQQAWRHHHCRNGCPGHWVHESNDSPASCGGAS